MATVDRTNNGDPATVTATFPARHLEVLSSQSVSIPGTGTMNIARHDVKSTRRLKFRAASVATTPTLSPKTFIRREVTVTENACPSISATSTADKGHASSLKDAKSELLAEAGNDDGDEKATSYEKDQNAIRRMVHLCRLAGITNRDLYQRVLEMLYTTNLRQETAAGISKVHDIWREVQRLIVANMGKIKEQTDWIKDTASPEYKFEDVVKVGGPKRITDKSAHQRRLERICGFLSENPATIDAIYQVQATEIKTARPDTLLPSNDSSGSSPNMRSTTSGDTVGHADHPIATLPALNKVSEIPDEASTAEYRLETLAEWYNIGLSVSEKAHLEVLVPLIISFRACGFGQPAIYQAPLDLLRFMNNTLSTEERESTIQELLRYTHGLVVKYQDILGFQTAITTDIGVSDAFKETVCRWKKSIEAMETFQLKYSPSTISSWSALETKKREVTPATIESARPTSSPSRNELNHSM
ncbi:hypothetical protein QFC21_002363 [Naganishia friedmannii]|uniref:Uncharacterized protein n=1 Tax=Naganishia friedmannii TaxID=89922 RepID=A0ACC2VWR8_9TREE|nr:hypothetical protein QFC21_002363 [Naganishia friedmannii]